MSAEVKIEWVVGCGSGVAPNPRFNNEADAIARYEEEIAVPSYFGAGHKRRASIAMVITVSQDVTPGRRVECSTDD